MQTYNMRPLLAVCYAAVVFMFTSHVAAIEVRKAGRRKYSVFCKWLVENIQWRYLLRARIKLPLPSVNLYPCSILYTEFSICTIFVVLSIEDRTEYIQSKIWIRFILGMIREKKRKKASPILLLSRERLESIQTRFPVQQVPKTQIKD
jgi:hypothetical protein